LREREQPARAIAEEEKRAYSSAGQSARLISVRPVVQVHLGPPKKEGM